MRLLVLNNWAQKGKNEIVFLSDLAFLNNWAQRGKNEIASLLDFPYIHRPSYKRVFGDN